jgi:hypothetical protein
MRTRKSYGRDSKRKGPTANPDDHRQPALMVFFPSAVMRRDPRHHPPRDQLANGRPLCSSHDDFGLGFAVIVINPPAPSAVERLRVIVSNLTQPLLHLHGCRQKRRKRGSSVDCRTRQSSEALLRGIRTRMQVETVGVRFACRKF